MKRVFTDERAATVTELAFILPVLLLFLFGIMEGGRVLSAWMVLTNETREAARYGVAGLQDQSLYNGGSSSAWLASVQTYAQSRIDQNLNAANLTIPTPVVTPPNGNAAGTLTVSAQYAVHMVTPLMSNLLGTVTVSARSVMRTE